MQGHFVRSQAFWVLYVVSSCGVEKAVIDFCQIMVSSHARLNLSTAKYFIVGLFVFDRHLRYSSGI